MKQKIFALFATGLVIVAGVITPAINFIAGTIEVQHVSAQLIDGPVVTPTPGYQGPGGGPNGEGAETGPVTSVGDPVAPTGGEATGTDATEIECGLNFICAALMVSSQVFMFMPNLLATVTGLVMDFSLWYSMQSSTYTAYDGTVGDEGIVVTGWKLVRDFSNLLFIFALFVIAFTLILGLDERAEGAPMGLDPKRTIARVIIMALLVNFSFFLGRSVIDITNVVGLTFYNKITAAPQATPGDSTAASSEVKGGPGDPASFYENAVGIRSISTGILAQVNPQSLLLSNKDVHGSGVLWKSYDWSTYISIWFLTFVSAAFNIFLMYIFGTIAILFLSRTIGLFLGIIISPIAFVSYTIPALQKKSFIGFDDWLKQFLGLAFMAPIFLFFLYIALQFFHISGLDKGSGYLATTAQILVKLALVGFLLVYAKNVAKDLSGKMGEMTSNAITSLATGAAVVAGVAATGGISGMARLGGRMAKEQLLSGGNSLGKAAFGEEKYAAMSKQWDRAGGFSMLKGRGIVSGVKTISRVATAGSEKDGLIDRFKEAKTINRRYDIEKTKEALAKAKAEKEKKDAVVIATKTKGVDKELADLKKDFDEGLKTKKEYEDERKVLAQKRKDVVSEVTDPAFAEKKAEKTALDNHRVAQKEANESATGKALSRSKTQLTAINTKLSIDTTALNDATAKLAAATTARVQADADAATKKTALDSAIATGAPAGDIARLTTAFTEAETTARDAQAAETTATNNKTTLQATFDATTRAHSTATTDHADLENRLKAENPYLAPLKTAVDEATAASKKKKEEVDIREEIRKRTIVSKTDTQNRELTADRVQTLQDRLRNIISGGTPPTTP